MVKLNVCVARDRAHKLGGLLDPIRIVGINALDSGGNGVGYVQILWRDWLWLLQLGDHLYVFDKVIQAKAQEADGALVDNVAVLVKSLLGLSKKELVTRQNVCVYARSIHNLAQMYLRARSSLVVVRSADNHDRFVLKWMYVVGEPLDDALKRR